MKQGFSGSIVQLNGNLVEKISTDKSFTSSKERQRDLITLSHKLGILPRIDHIAGQSIFMEFVEGKEGLTKQNAQQAGEALRLLHEQSEYPYPCMTGLDWLIQMAHENYGDKDFSGFKAEYPTDALIHSEPAQFIEKKDGTITFIDIEGIGMGSRYQDLASIYYISMIDEKLELFDLFIEGYQSRPVAIEPARVRKLAGLYSIAYAAFAESERRIEFGLGLLLDEIG
jgi:hypothetical protein